MKADGTLVWNSFHLKPWTRVCSARRVHSSFLQPVFLSLEHKILNNKWKHTHKSCLCLQEKKKKNNLNVPCNVYKDGFKKKEKGRVRGVRSAEWYWKDPPQWQYERERNPKGKTMRLPGSTLQLNNAEQGSWEVSWQCCWAGNTVTYSNSLQCQGSLFFVCSMHSWPKEEKSGK